jgi:exodeoxyribonuclease VII large subunit
MNRESTGFPFKIYSVFEITEGIKRLLQEGIGYVYIRGEVSNLRRSDAGHSYFTLKDDKSQIMAVLFRSYNTNIPFKDGSRVIVGGMINVYPPRGLYQIVVNEIIQDGLGELYIKFEELKKRLSEKGLFSEEIKKAIPEYVFHIGLITSPYGAAVRDFLKTVFLKNSHIKVSVYAARVQGEGAAGDVIAGIRYFNRLRDVDVIAIIRGGGSFEDLFCFNDESLAYAIRESEIPVVSGIGHEIDYTIADYVADLRASTPTGAAEVIVKDETEILDCIKGLKERLDEAVVESLNERKRVIERFIVRFYQDRERFEDKAAQIQQMIDRIQEILRGRLTEYYNSIFSMNTHLERFSPAHRLKNYEERLNLIRLRLNGAILSHLDLLDNRLENLNTKLELINPENILKKGYSLVYRGDRIIRSVRELSEGDNVKIHFYDGDTSAVIKK